MKHLSLPWASSSVFFVLLLAFAPCAWSQVVGRERDQEEANIRALATEFRKLERAVLERLNEIKTKNESVRANHQELQIRVMQANAAYEEARLAVDVAEVAIKEYDLFKAVQDMEVAEGEISLATAAIQLDKDNLKERESLVDTLEKADTTNVLIQVQLFDQRRQLLGERLRVARGKLQLEQAQTKKEVLIKYTKPVRQKELRAAFEKAKSVALTKKAALSIEADRLEKCRREAAHPLGLTDGEKTALVQVQVAVGAWKKVLAKRDEYRKNPITAKFETLMPQVLEAVNAHRKAQQSWDDAQDIRQEEVDAELEKQLQTLGIKPAR